MSTFGRGMSTVGTVLENPFATGAERAGQDFARGGGGGGEAVLGIILLPFVLSTLLAMIAGAVVSILSFPVVWLGSNLIGGERRTGPFTAWKASAVGLGVAWTLYGFVLLVASWGGGLAGRPVGGAGGQVLGAIALGCQAIGAMAITGVAHLFTLLTGQSMEGTKADLFHAPSGALAVFAIAVLAGLPIIGHAFVLGRFTKAYRGFLGFLAACGVSAVNIAIAVVLGPWLVVQVIAALSKHG